MHVDLSWTVEDVDGVRFVACRLHNGSDVPRGVRIESRLPGPVLPPRRAGVPEAGWDRDGMTLRLDPDASRGIGFASLAPPHPSTARESRTSAPVEVVDEGAVEDDERSRSDDVAEALRRLGEHRPPGDGVASGALDDSAGSRTDDATVDSAAATVDSAAATDVEDETTTDFEDDTADGRSRPTHPNEVPVAIDPDRIDDWFGVVERRVERAERLTDADLDSATEVVASLGGTDTVADLDDQVADDVVLLRQMSERAASLADRAEGVDVPTEALERLA